MSSVRRTVMIVLVAAAALALAGPAVAAQSARVAALQVALRSQGLYTGAVDGVSGPMTREALLRFQRKNGIRATGKIGMATRCKLGKLGMPLLGQRGLSSGRVGWDVASLEFSLRRFGLPAGRIDGRFDAATAAALRRFQRSRGLEPDGVAGVRTFRALARGKAKAASAPALRARVHTVKPGEGFVVIARRYRIQPTVLARANDLTLTSVLTPGQRLRVPGRTVVVRPVARTRPSRNTVLVHTVQPGEGFFLIARRYGVRANRLASANGLRLTSLLTPGQRLQGPGSHRRRPEGAGGRRSTPEARHRTGGELLFDRPALPRQPVAARAGERALADGDDRSGPAPHASPGGDLGDTGPPVDRNMVRAAIDRWSATYGVDARLARAVAWMESGFQEDVVSSAGAIGVMQLLPETWEWIDAMLLGEVTPRTYDGNVRAGVRYLRWQLDQFDGDMRLALAGYYQGARAVRERQLDDTKQYVSVILKLYGSI